MVGLIQRLPLFWKV